MHVIENFKSFVLNACKNPKFDGKSYVDIGKEILCHQKECSSAAGVSKYIYSKIKIILAGQDINTSGFNDIRNYFVIGYFIETNFLSKKYFQFIEVIRDASRGLNSYTSDPHNWEVAVEHVAAYLALKSHDPADSIGFSYHREKALANAYNYFVKKKYNIGFSGGKFLITDYIHNQISFAIEMRIRKLGLSGLISFLKIIRKNYDSNINRYIFNRISKTPLIPIGFLFKLSVKYLAKSNHKVGLGKTLSELIELSINYSTLIEVQEYHSFETMIQSPESILKTIQNMVINDQIYSINQANCEYVIDIISGIYSSPKCIKYKMPWSVAEFISIANTIIDIGKLGTPVRFSTERIAAALNYKHNSKLITLLLNDLSHDAGEINSGFKNYFGTGNLNYNYKPLVKYGTDEYLLIDLSFFSFGFYEVISSKFRGCGLRDELIGELLEEYIKNKLTASNITYMSGVNYHISNKLQKELGTNRSHGECDFIIELEDTIIFIEVKKKILTRESQSGNILKISLDLIKSFANSQIQANWHELILRKKGFISFESGETLLLNNRNVEKLSLSMFDFMSLHDGNVIQQIMTHLVGRELVSESEDDLVIKSLKMINQALLDIHTQFNTPEFAQYKSSSNPYFNCRFFNLFHFLELLKDVNSNLDFKNAIWRNRHATTGQKDWFHEYNYLKKLKP